MSCFLLAFFLTTILPTDAAGSPELVLRTSDYTTTTTVNENFVVQIYAQQGGIRINGFNNAILLRATGHALPGGSQTVTFKNGLAVLVVSTTWAETDFLTLEVLPEFPLPGFDTSAQLQLTWIAGPTTKIVMSAVDAASLTVDDSTVFTCFAFDEFANPVTWEWRAVTISINGVAQLSFPQCQFTQGVGQNVTLTNTKTETVTLQASFPDDVTVTIERPLQTVVFGAG